MAVTFDLAQLDPEKVVRIDLGSPETKRNIRAVASEWARRAPFYVERDGHVIVVCGRHADALEVYQDRDRFSTVVPQEPGYEMFDKFNGVRVLVQMDGAPHDRIRRLLTGAFLPKAINRLEPGITTAVDQALDRITAMGGRFDGRRDYAEPLVVETLLTELLGLPPQHKHVFLEVNRVIPLITYTAAGHAYPPAVTDAFEAARQLVFEIIAERRATPRVDMISDLIAARDEGDRLSDQEMFDQVFTLCAAAFSGTINGFSGAIHALYSHPEAVAELKADPSLIPQAISECLRWQTVYLSFPRFVMRDTEVGGTRLLKGMVVRASAQAAHMDPDAYPDPLRFDIHRNPRIVAFGSGPHLCLGHYLAKLLMRVGIERLMRRFPDARLAQPDTPLEYEGAVGELRIIDLPMLTA